MTASAEAESAKRLRTALWVLLIVYIFNFLDRSIINILAEPIKKDLGLSDTQIGLMTGVAFAAFYTFLGIPIARYADRPGTSRPKIIAVAITLWSAMTAISGFAQSFFHLLLARIGVGIGEAGCTPPAHSLIADLAEPKKRAAAMAFYALGIPIGTLLGVLIGGQLADTIGWRKAFIIVGLPGVLMSIVVLWLVKDPRRATSSAARPTPALAQISVREAVAAVFSSRAFVLVMIAGTSASFLSYGKSLWTLIFFQRTHGLSTADTGFWFGVWGGVAGIVGTWLGGWLADRYGVTNRRHVLTAPAIGMALAIPLAFIAYQLEDWPSALAMLLLPTLFNSLYYGPTYSSVQGLVRPEARAMASAILLFSQNLIGLGLGPLFFGMLSDAFKPVAGADSVRWVLYGAAWLGLVPAFFFWRASLRLNAELDRNG